jgi:nucleotide-binding universal stress UspA family protein
MIQPVTGPGRSQIEGEKPKSAAPAVSPLAEHETSTIAPYSSEGMVVETPKKRMSYLEYQSTIRAALYNFYQALLEIANKDVLLAASLANSIGYENIPTDEEIKKQYESDVALLERGQQYIDAYNLYLKKLQESADHVKDAGETLKDVWSHISGSSEDFEAFNKKYEDLKASADLSTPEGQKAYQQGLEELLISCEELYQEISTNYETLYAATKEYKKAVEQFNVTAKSLEVSEEEWNEVKNLIESTGRRLPHLPEFPGLEDTVLYAIQVPEQTALPVIKWPDPNEVDFSDPKAVQQFEKEMEIAIRTAATVAQELENLVSSDMAIHHLNEDIIAAVHETKPIAPLEIPTLESYQTCYLIDLMDQISQEAYVKLALAAGLNASAASDVSDYIAEFKRSRLEQSLPSAWGGDDVPVTGSRLPKSKIEQAHVEAFLRELNERILERNDKISLQQITVDYAVFLESLGVVAVRDAVRFAPSISLKNAFVLSFLKVLEGVGESEIQTKAGGNKEIEKIYSQFIDHLKKQLTNYLVETNDITVQEKSVKFLNDSHEFLRQELKDSALTNFHMDQLLKGLDLLELGAEVRSEVQKTAPELRGARSSV